MKLGRRERIGVCAMLIALVGFAFDRLIIQAGPRTADAATSSARSERGLAPSPAEDADASADAGASWSPPVLPGEIPDVFDGARLTRAASPPTVVDESAAARGPDAADRFRQSHSLTATILGPRPLALIDGRLYGEGALVDGFRIEAIRSDRVELLSASGRVVLEVPQLGARKSDG